ncbi:MAG: transposase [Nitrospinaceae bacterium]|nr:transposase [Nitrospinaceae bacterium]
MVATRKHFSSQQKVKIIKMHLVEGVPLSDLCDKHGIHPSAFYRWQKAFFERGHLAFEHSDGKGSKDEKKIAKLEKKITDKNEVLAELMEEHVALKKSLGET